MRIIPPKKGKGIYKFVIRKDVIYPDTDVGITFENEWIAIDEDGEITVKGTNKDGYAWDGCSPKFNFFDLFLIGTPDGINNVNTGKPITYYASLIHDALYQFRKDIGISRKKADQIFLQYLGGFRLRYIYYYAVRAFGGLYSFFK